MVYAVDESEEVSRDFSSEQWSQCQRTDCEMISAQLLGKGCELLTICQRGENDDGFVDNVQLDFVLCRARGRRNRYQPKETVSVCQLHPSLSERLS